MDNEKVFKYRLARELHMTVTQLEAEMTTVEFMEWNVFLRLEHEKKL